MTRLNERELSMMDSPMRRLSQRAVELRMFRHLLRRANVELHGRDLLDAGCGNGYGLELLTRTFQPRRLVGFDLMPEQIERARARRLAAEIAVGDITKIAERDASFDGVFVFGILHHVPNWRAALIELGRVLRPGGVLLVEEIHGTAVRIEDRLLGTSHPREASFDWLAFRGGIADAGLTIAAETGLLCGAMRSFAAVKPHAPRA
jgi:ubiquinone/menaquinone biosynthesis C-methylase UbiE